MNESYWKQRNAELRAEIAARVRDRFWKYHDAILIQGRLRRKGFKVTISEAGQLARKYGCCYPTRAGLTAWALRECERIRSSQRHLPKHKRNTPTEIRMMMYEDGHFKKPSKQKPPYQRAARQLREWWQRQKHQAGLAPIVNNQYDNFVAS